LKDFRDAQKGLRSSGKFPISSKICHALPLFGLTGIDSVRVMMALLWIHDSTDDVSSGEVISAHMSEIRAASGLGGSRAYRSTRNGLNDLARSSLVFQNADVCEIVDFISIREDDEKNTCYFRFSEEVIELQGSHTESGYGMIDMSEIHRLARPIDLWVYLRLCSVKKRRKKKIMISRDEIFCIAERNPEGNLGDAMRALKSSIARVSAIMKMEVKNEQIAGPGRERTIALEVSIV
jgi:hypothetical protein